MILNIKKCHAISFHRSAGYIHFEYSLDGSSLERAYSTRDLGIILSANLSPNDHIDSIINKASRMFGFVIRTSRRGLSIEAMKTVYVSLVRSVLEFGSVVWSPYQLGQIQRLQRIQDRFVRVVGVRLGFEYLDVPVRAVEEFLGLNPLIVRRQLHDLTFLQRVLVGDLDCPALLRLINIRVPGRTRSADFFCRPSCSTNHELNSVIPRLHRLGNLVSANYDFFYDSTSSLRTLFLD
ncbi:uncharacterized protein LOC124358350 [Homalodisca vitripennis]|uniref:uncharacterized protein LOC124358350 n=1 Tax=Homalodisca vitripennis TaxID=197043 RepID=UPI001EEB3FC6|nr:uncharacterized protein LOC124358350 [Homalodisca vitripennis]